MGRTASELRGRILEAALALFVVHGYGGTSLHDIAAEVGCSKASLLYHFANKEALLTEVLTPAAESLGELSAELAGLTGEQAVETAVTGYVDLALRHRREVRLLFSDLPEALDSPAFARIPTVAERLLTALSGGLDTPADRVAAWMVLGAVFVTSAGDVAAPEEVLRREMVNSALRTLGRAPR